MTEIEVVTQRNNRPPPESKAVFIRQLMSLRRDASDFGLSKVVICLDYAYWETLAAEAPLNPLGE